MASSKPPSKSAAPTSAKASAAAPISKGRVFVSYAHKDKKTFDLLKAHLRPLERDGLLDIWDDTKIVPGTKWKDEIAKASGSASAAILLVSADFLASEFIAGKELAPLLDAAEAGGTRILWLLVRPCNFEAMDQLAQYQALHDAGRAISTLSKPSREIILASVAKQLISLSESPKAHPTSGLSRPTTSRPKATKAPALHMVDLEPPAILWSLPRGFLVMENIIRPTKDDSWAVTVTYYTYPAEWQHGTHYHESYEDWWLDDMYEGQLRKLRIPEGDWFWGREAIDYLKDIRHGRVVIDQKGVVKGAKPYPEIASVATKTPHLAPVCPKQYRSWAVSGPLRDAEEQVGLLVRKLDRVPLADAHRTARDLRREARLQAFDLLEKGHPACQHIDEAWTRVEAASGAHAFRTELGDFGTVVGEAEAAVRKAIESKKGEA